MRIFKPSSSKFHTASAKDQIMNRTYFLQANMK